jgi:hypothetical protein
MRFDELRASADIVGRRIWVSWEYAFDPLETPGDLPEMLLRRKERDYDFPPLVPGDPYLVYDSVTFPPAPVPGTLEILDLPSWETVEDGLRGSASAISVIAISAGVRQEVLRLVQYLIYGGDGAPVRVRFELLDAGGLEPRTPYYYEVDDGSAPTDEVIGLYRAMAVPGATHGLNRRFYEMLPEVYKRHDVRLLPPENEFPGVPEASPAGGQLRRFVDMFGMGLDAVRSSAENLLDMHDGYRTQARFLPPLSRMIGWEPTNIFGIPVQRNELLTATRLFDVVGTVPALRALVTHQTRWHSQVAEFAQHVVRANESPRRSVFAAEEQVALGGAVWQGIDDAASVFAFPPGGAIGFGVAPAVMASTQLEPFPLRAGMELTITVDGGVPARVRFGPDDFEEIGAATAAEVSAAISAAFDDIVAQGVGGAVELRTHAVGPEASVEVEISATSLASVNDAPRGPLSAFVDDADRIRLFYEQRRDPGRPEQATFPARLATPSRNGTAARAEGGQRRVVLYKSWGYGEWRPELELPAWTGEPTDPWAARLDDGRVWLGWTDLASRPECRLRFALGAPRDATPAVITGSRPQPFALQVGTQLVIRGDFGSELFTVVGADYVDPANATAVEVAAAMNAQLVQATASTVAGGAIRLSTVATGTDAWLQVDLSQSTAARRLGLESRSILGRGGWDTAVDWEGARDMSLLWAPVADPSAVRDPLGGARIFWSEHQRGRWQIRQAHWSERLTVVTPSGVAQRTDGPWQVWVMADGLPSDDVRAIAVDASGSLWLATAAGLASRRPDGVWEVFTTADGLSDDDVRDLAFLPNGSLWCATPAGVSVLAPGGAFSVLGAGVTGLVADDVRAVATDGLGNAWAATPAGVSRLGADQRWVTWTAADGLSAGAPRGIAAAPDGRLAIATSAGVSIFADGTWTTYTTTDGLAGNDARAVAWGAGGDLFVATGAGLAIREGDRWRRISTVEGLPANDLHDVAIAPDGQLVLGTGVGVVIGRDRAWTVEDASDGLPTDQVVGVHTTWSSPVVLADALGGHREPRAAVDAVDRTWLVWAGREEAAAGLADTWTLRLRRFDPGALAWGWDPETAVTASPGGTSDREPSLEPAAAGGFRVFFSSDRGGGRGIWWLTLDSMGAAGPLASMPDDASESSSPVAVTGPSGRSWLFYRSDRWLVPSQVGMLPGLDAPARASERVPDAGALRLRAGCGTVRLSHAARNLGRRRWGDFFTYTPEYPHLVSEDVPTDDHLYTRRTIGLYLRQARTGEPITQEEITRLLQLLRRFLPINLRVVLIVSPDPLVEFVYTDSSDITDAWQDEIPIVDVLDGLSDATAVSAPDLAVLITNDLESLTADLGDLTTLRRRTWFPDLL